jgi:phosphate transport system substrate-binding protein
MTRRKEMKRILTIALLLIGMLSLNQAQAEEMLNGAGATFPYPVYSAWANEYNKITGVKLNYQSIGSGGGIKQITERTVDFGASDKPLKPEELAKDNLIQFPAVIGGVVPVVNIAGIKAGELRLDAETVCGIYMGEIKNWGDTKIKE